MPDRANPQKVTELFSHFSTGNIPGVMALLDDAATWRIAGKPAHNPSAGTYDKARIRGLFDAMMGRLKAPLQMSVTGMTADGDRVAAEVVSRGELKNGRVYEQEYHFLIEFRDGRIVAVREYLDTQHAFATWLQR